MSDQEYVERPYTYEISKDDSYPPIWAVGKLYADETMTILSGERFDTPDEAQARADELQAENR